MDATAFGAEMVALVKDFLEQELDPLREKLAALEQQIASQPAPRDPDVGEVAKAAVQIVRDDVDELLRDVLKAGDGEAMIAKAVQSIPAPLTGENVKAIVGEAIASMPAAPTEDHLVSLAAERILPEIKELRSAIEAIPAVPELPDIPAMISEAVSAIPAPPSADDMKAMIDEAVAAIPPAQPGKDADQEAIEAKIAEEVQKAVSAIERPKDGHSPTPEEYGPLLADAVQKAVAALPVPKDGVNLAGALIDREGSLILTLSDGSTRDLGKVVGKDAEPVDMVALERRAVEMIEALPKPRDGLDGFGFDDMDAVYDGERTVTLRFVKGERVKEFPLHIPMVLDRGVFKEGRTYQAGDGVTWAGSFWIAQDETGNKPEGGKGWRLAVKRGRDGTDAIVRTVNEKPVVKANA